MLNFDRVVNNYDSGVGAIRLKVKDNVKEIQPLIERFNEANDSNLVLTLSFVENHFWLFIKVLKNAKFEGNRRV